MTDSRDTHNPHDPLLTELSRLFSASDPVPDAVTEHARAALGWRRIDAELAELLSDTSLDETAFAATRGSGAPVRSVSFSAEELTVDVQVLVDDGERTLLGQVAPPGEVELLIQTADDPAAATARTDALGRFRVRLSGDQAIRLRISPGGEGAAVVETSWIRI